MEQREIISDDALPTPPRRPTVGWYEEAIPIRGCSINLEVIKEIYEELSVINRKFGQDIVATLQPNPDMNAAEWEQHKAYLLQDAFCLTVSIRGERDQLLMGEDAGIFSSAGLPKPIRTIYFNNITAWGRHANNTEPENRIEVLLDFSKPALFDPNPVVSNPTPNSSNVTVKARDMTYFRAVQRVIEAKLSNRRTWYAPIHRSFAYDVGMWTVALPAGLILSTYYMDRWLPVGSDFSAYRWAFFLYAVGVVLLGYRFLTGYVKWAFPVNVLTDNKDKALRHRLALGGIFAWLAYKAADAIYGLLPLSI